ncbi:MAG: hypothetical protein ACI4XC_05225 [Eubacterium sp.]
MKKVIISATVGFAILTAVFSALYLKYDITAFESLAITFGTVLYHFVMRLTVGFIVPHRYRYTDEFFTEKTFEKPLYNRLKVKKWKRFMPSYNPASYSVRNNELEHIANTTCRNEVIHLVICVLSFVPILFSIPFGETAVFVITSVLSCMFDMIFVIMQRYNRPRIVKLINRRANKIF